MVIITCADFSSSRGTETKTPCENSARPCILPNFGFTRVNYDLARTLLRLGRPAEAVATLQSSLRGEIDASNLYITRTDLHDLLADAFQAAGQADSAAVHYRAVVNAWRRADPQYQPRRARASAWLSRYASAGSTNELLTHRQ